MAKGYLIVQTSLANQSLPLAGAEVKIDYYTGGNQVKLAFITDPEGKTKKVEIETPVTENSLIPQKTREVFTLVDILISAKGFYSVRIKGAQIFPETVSLQYVNMLPLPQGVTEGEKVVNPSMQNL